MSASPFFAPPEPCPCRDDVCLSVAAAVGWAALCVLAGAAFALACARAAASCSSGDDDGGHGGDYAAAAAAGHERGAAAAQQQPSASAPPQMLLSEPLLALRPVPSDVSLASLAPDGSGVPSSTSFSSSPVLRAVAVGLAGRGDFTGAASTSSEDPAGFR